eukprot:scaffold746_cov293-Chaetoceros_neogracile.AAC.27
MRIRHSLMVRCGRCTAFRTNFLLAAVVFVAASLLNCNDPLLVDALSPPVSPHAAKTTRRSFLYNPLIATIAISASLPKYNAKAAIGPSVNFIISDGMAAFARGDVDKSIEIYDDMILNEPRRKPYLWQRGLSLYYAKRYQDGAEQFATDVAVNPNDTEEQIWHLLCLAQLEGGSLEKARTMKLTVGRDRRPVMQAVQTLFLSGGEENEKRLVEIANTGDLGSRFYGKLYLSLYYESLGDAAEAEKWMIQAVGTDYAKGSGIRDPMVELAKVAIKKRGWSS